MEIFAILQEQNFSFVAWLQDGAALYQHSSNRLMAISWHPDQELEMDSLLTQPARVVDMTGGANSAVELTKRADRFEEAVRWIAEGRLPVHFVKDRSLSNIIEDVAHSVFPEEDYEDYGGAYA